MKAFFKFRSVIGFLLVLVIVSNLCAPIIAADVFPGPTSGIGWHLRNGTLTLETNQGIAELSALLNTSAWEHLPNITTLVIGQAVQDNLSPVLNHSMPNLSAIQVDSGNFNFSAVQDVLFSYDRTQLLKYPAAKPGQTYEVPYGTLAMSHLAFADNGLLSTITISPTVIAIGERTFENAGSLQTIEVSLQNNRYLSVDGVLFDKSGTILLTFPPQNSAVHYTVPQGVETIIANAFGYTPALQSIMLPDSLLTLDIDFNNLPALQAIQVAQTNEEYSSDGLGVLYNKSKSSLLRYPMAGPELRFQIPQGVQTLGANCFFGSQLTQVIFPSTLQSIGQQAFAQCQSLSALTIPHSVTQIASAAFQGNAALTQVFFQSAQPPQLAEDIFAECPQLSTILVPQGTKTLYQEALPQYKDFVREQVVHTGDGWTLIDGLLTLETPDSLIDLNAAVSSDTGWPLAEQVTALTLSDQVTAIQGPLPSHLPKLQAYIVSADHPTLSSLDGVLLNKAQSILLHYPMNKRGESYRVPTGINGIYAGAFDGSPLKRLSLPQSVEEIALPLGANTPLIQIAVDMDNTTYYSIDGVLFCEDKQTLLQYPSQKPETQYIVPGGVETVASNAFSSVNALATLDMGDTVSMVEPAAVVDCSALERVILSKNITTIENAFQRCNSLANLDVSPENPVLSSQEGVLLTKDRSRLLLYPSPKREETYRLPDEVVSVADTAFAGAQALKSLTISPKTTLSPTTLALGSNLEALLVPQDNPSHLSKDGVLFSKDGNILQLYPPAKTGEAYEIPVGVKVVASYAFPQGSLSQLNSVTFPPNLTYIAPNSLDKVASLQKLIFNGLVPPFVDGGCDFRQLTCIDVPNGCLTAYQKVFPLLGHLINMPDDIGPPNGNTGSGTGGGISGPTIPPKNPVIEGTIFVSAVVNDAQAAVSVSQADLLSAITQAGSGGQVQIKVTADQADNISITFPNLPELKNCNGLTIHTALGTICLRKSSLSTLLYNSKETITLQIKRHPVTSPLPSGLLPTGYTVQWISDGAALPNIETILQLPYVLQQDEVADSMVLSTLTDQGSAPVGLSYYNNQALTMTAKLTLPATVFAEHRPAPFQDVADQWFTPSVAFAYSHGLFDGVDKNIFAPHNSMTRGMFATALARLAGVDAAQYTTNAFSDLSPSAWYSGPVAWAWQNQIISGLGNGTFAPEQPITRQEMAVMLYRYIHYIIGELPQPETDPFADQDSISPWAQSAILFLKSRNIISGNGAQQYDPLSTAQRSAVAAVFKNYMIAFTDF